MKYIIRKAILGKTPEIEVTAEEYAEFKKARNILTNVLAIEEKYEIVIANYLDFERRILNSTTDDMVRGHADYPDAFEVRLGLNICVVNLLTAAKLYVDSVNRNVRECVPNISDTKELVKNFFSTEYDNNKDYRFMEALRNHVQHQAIPVHLVQQGSRRQPPEVDGLLEYYMEVYSQRSTLEENPKFKKSVLAENDDKIDLKAATRSYVESMSNVHESIRNIITESVSQARELIEEAHRQYAAIYSESLVGLTASEWLDGRKKSSVPLLLDWDDVRVKLQERNKKLINLRKRYVTSCLK